MKGGGIFRSLYCCSQQKFRKCTCVLATLEGCDKPERLNTVMRFQIVCANLPTMNSSKNSRLVSISDFSKDFPAVMGNLSGAGWDR